jgi:TRAP transporter TAXI family solute receptor
MKPTETMRMAGTFVAAMLSAIVLSSSAIADEVRFFRIATGSIAGTYFPIGSIIASAISNPPGSRPCEDGGSCGVPGLIAVAQTTKGSVENVQLLLNGGTDSALVQADVAHWAHAGQNMFAKNGPAKDLRAIASLYPESVHVVVRKSSGIDSIRELKGKQISVGVSGSGTMLDATLILAAHGLKKGSYKAIRKGPAASASALRDGKLDAMLFVAGYPVSAITTLAEEQDIKLLPINGKYRKALTEKHAYFSAIEIPAGTYANVGGVETIAVNAQWIVSANLDKELVYAMTRALWHANARRLLDRGHPEGRNITLDKALDGLAIPLHEGAMQYYRDVELLD